jgi:small subunit ribosomal protein S8
MSLSDPIADMLTRIRNGQAARKKQVTMPASKMKMAMAQVLKEEGYLIDCQMTEGVKPILTLSLKYYQGKPVISQLKRVSRPGLRIYRPSNELPQVMGGLGIAIISTPRGIMTNKKARAEKQGGEVLCLVS